MLAHLNPLHAEDSRGFWDLGNSEPGTEAAASELTDATSPPLRSPPVSAFLSNPSPHLGGLGFLFSARLADGVIALLRVWGLVWEMWEVRG